MKFSFADFQRIIERNEKGKGKISLQFSSDEELENIMDVFDKIIIVK